ncbi:MAG: hypothetical protein BWY74_03762 [Firmicutes bacterium ADurb.Bin419]|nr:MAG: hypothetical protein BWY74_03762 [Firmicutes bacterium ADurb.Bin419]
MPGKPFQSKLNQFLSLIEEMRKEKMSYAKIAEVLREQHGMAVAASSIHSFVKSRSKVRRCYTIKNVKINTKPKNSKICFLDGFVNNIPINTDTDTEKAFIYKGDEPIK